jgi:heme-degrading monooxygenase HmoA
MTIKIIIDRQFKKTPSANDIRIFNDLRIRAMGQNGYIGGETLVDAEDNKRIVVLSVWSNMDNWETWRNSRERANLEKGLTPHLEEPAKIRVLMMGTESLRKILTEVIHESELAA